jgi:outer membrane protein assembly factor BamA
MRIAFSLLFVTSLLGQAVADAQKPVVIEKVTVKGSRLPASAVLGHFPIKAGQSAAELEVREACQKLTATGLFSNIGYLYETIEGKESVALELEIADEQKLLPARVVIPGIDEAQALQWLRELDPIFTSSMPYTQAAISLYVRGLELALKNNGHEMRVIGNVEGTKDGVPVRVEFTRAREMPAPGGDGRGNRKKK